MDGITSDIYNLRAANTERVNKLRARGVVLGDTGPLFIEAALEVLLGDRLDEARLAFELKVSRALDGIEQAAEADLARARLLAPPTRPIIGGKP